MAIEGKTSGKEYTVYTLLGDGEIQEGIVYEAAEIANKYRLDNLVAIVDRNTVQNDGVVDEIMPIEVVEDRFDAFGWATTRINGHDIEQVLAALRQAKEHKGSPFCIVADTVKGKGVSFMQNDRYWHGKPPTEEQYNAARAELMGGKK
jgi:transketolase